MRKATIKKNKTYKFGKFLKKGEEVFIKENPIGNAKFTYIAFRKEDDTLGLTITASEFEYIEEVEFTVSVTRIAYANRNIVVKAKTRKEAEELALDEAGEHEFSEHTSEFTSGGAYLKTELE